jgi:large subunit ribosomal protein L17
MVTSLFKYERIRTTDVKAKALRSWADHIITLAKRGDLHARRQALAIVREDDVVHKLFEEAPERFKDISGGYTRIIKLGPRPGDAAPISVIELVSADKAKTPKVRRPKEESSPAASPAESQLAPQVLAPDTVSEPVSPAESDAQASESEKTSES